MLADISGLGQCLKKNIYLEIVSYKASRFGIEKPTYFVFLWMVYTFFASDLEERDIFDNMPKDVFRHNHDKIFYYFL